MQVFMKCRNCGFENPKGMKFCGNCGSKIILVSDEEEFRTITVLFMDMVGFTKFSENMDPEELKNIPANESE